MAKTLKLQSQPPARRTSLTGVSLLVLVAFAMGASRSELGWARGHQTEHDRTAVVTTTVQSRAARPQRKQEERPVAQRPSLSGLARATIVEFVPNASRTAIHQPRLREALIALPPPAMSV